MEEIIWDGNEGHRADKGIMSVICRIEKVCPSIHSTKECQVLAKAEGCFGFSFNVALYFYHEDRQILHQLWLDLNVGEEYLAEGEFGFFDDPLQITLYGPTLTRLDRSSRGALSCR